MLDDHEDVLGPLGQHLTKLHGLVRRQCETGGKNVELLVTSALCARLMGAARTTSCKSAKDRTSVFHTLEMARLLAWHGLLDGSALPVLQPVLDELRGPRGVRLTNCQWNTGRPLYSFNDLQLQVFPAELVPPSGTFSSGGQT